MCRIIENSQLKILYDAMENQKEVTLEFQEASRKYTCQGYILGLTLSHIVMEGSEGDKKDALLAYNLKYLVSVRVK